MPLKIVFVKKLYSPVGGSEALTYQWARRLARRGHDVRVLSLWPVRRRHGFPVVDANAGSGRHYRAFNDGGVAVFQIAPHGGALGKLLDITPFFNLMPLSVALEVAGTCHIVHNVCREYTAVARAIAKQRGALLVLTPLPHPGQPFSGASTSDFASYREADGIVAMTAHEKRWYESIGVAGERVAVIGSGAAVGIHGDALRFRRRYAIAGPLVLYVGRQEPYKGYLSIADAAPTVWQSHPNTHFAFIGQKSFVSRFHDPLSKRADPRIIDLALVSELDKADAYAACDVFCMPSVHETLGLTYLEAWSYGKPVIGADIPAVRDVISRGQDGLLVQQQADSVAAAISSLLDDPALARQMGEAGRRKTRGQFDWDTVIDKLEGFYGQLREPLRAAVRPE